MHKDSITKWELRIQQKLFKQHPASETHKLFEVYQHVWEWFSCKQIELLRVDESKTK